MTVSNDFDRQLLAYLEAAGPSDVGSEVVASALDTARGLDQRRGLVAWVVGPGSWPVFAGRLSLRRLPPVLRLGIVVALTLALVGGAVLVGSRLLADSAPFPRPPYNGTFEPVGRTYAEGEFEATSAGLLPDGRVVAATSVWAPNRIEAWDPTSGTVQDLGSTLKRRLGATLVVLNDGRILLIGGDATKPNRRGPSSERATAEVFDPSTGTSVLTGPMSGADEGFLATLLPEGRVLKAGGSLANRLLPADPVAETYDPATNSWTPVPPSSSFLYGATATRLLDGRVLIVEPGPDTIERSRFILRYDPATGKLSYAGELARRPAAAGVLLDDGRVLFPHGRCGAPDGIGPVSSELFDPVDGALTVGPVLPHCVETATALPDGNVLITGYWPEGFDSIGQPNSLLPVAPLPTSTWAGLLDPISGLVRIVDGPDRYGAVPAVLADGRVVFVGGTSLSGDVSAFRWGQIFR